MDVDRIRISDMVLTGGEWLVVINIARYFMPGTDDEFLVRGAFRDFWVPASDIHEHEARA